MHEDGNRKRSLSLGYMSVKQEALSGSLTIRNVPNHLYLRGWSRLLPEVRGKCRNRAAEIVCHKTGKGDTSLGIEMRRVRLAIFQGIKTG